MNVRLCGINIVFMLLQLDFLPKGFRHVFLTENRIFDID